MSETGTKLQSTFEREQALLIPTYERFPVLFERGEGAYIYDTAGKKYLDFLSGIGVTALGHAHPAVTKTITEQAAKLLHTSNLFFHEYQAKLASLLVQASGLDRAFFSNSGTEAWEGALKLARAYAKAKAGSAPAKTDVLVTENSFHGRTYGALSTTGQKKYRDPFVPLVGGVVFANFNDVADLKAKFTDSVCAIGFETIQGEGGIRPVSQEFISAARELCDRSGALLLLDEIQCGLGRTGRYFAYQHYGVKPDIVTLAKPIANGLPLGALLATNEVAAAFHAGMHGTTFGGGPLACAVAVTVMEELAKSNLLAHIAEAGAHFWEKLEGIKAANPVVKEIRGIGLMLGAELTSVDVAKAVMKQMLERGYIINRTNENVLRFLPPFIINTAQIDELSTALSEVLEAVTAETGDK